MRRHLTYANVMATVAVFIALGGTATAAITLTGKNIKNNTITSADIKNGTIKAADIKPRSLKARNFKRGQLPAGPAGAAGAPGPAGANGTNATTVGWARVFRDRSTSPGNPGQAIGEWAAPASENLTAVAGGTENRTVCLQFAQAPRGIVAMPASPYVTVRGGVDAAGLASRCAAALPAANAYVYATDAQATASDAFDAFVSAY